MGGRLPLRRLTHEPVATRPLAPASSEGGPLVPIGPTLVDCRGIIDEHMTLLSLDRVSKNFGPLLAVGGVSFTVGRGEVVGFLGPNGAGKSTTMRMITQYLDPDYGVISFDGIPLEQAREEAKRRIGYLPENNPLYSD